MLRGAVNVKPNMIPEGVISGENVILGEQVVVAPTARIHGSTRGTRISIGSNSEVYDYVVIRCVGGHGDIEIGEYCYLNPGTVLYSGNGIKFGNYVLVASGVKIMPTNHAYGSREIPIRHQGFASSKGGIEIEDDVWIGSNAVILDGARIGRGAIIAAGSVVGGTVPPYEIWGGVPAVKIRDRPE
jgi:acetyltransferase-like isoleucine patch superfamily enzyme